MSRRWVSALAWADDGDIEDGPVVRQSWRLAIGYAAVLLSCALVTAFVTGVVVWVELKMEDDAVPALITSADINGAVTR
jgi:hypothetical protein